MKDKLRDKMDNELKKCTPEQRAEIEDLAQSIMEFTIQASKFADEEIERRNACIKDESKPHWRKPMPDFATRIKGLRENSGKSLQEVADAIGASKAHMLELEQGRSTNPTLELLKKLAAFYNVTVGYLAGEQDDK